MKHPSATKNTEWNTFSKVRVCNARVVVLERPATHSVDTVRLQAITFAHTDQDEGAAETGDSP